MLLRRLGLYCALALSPFAFLAGCSPTAGLDSTSATPQTIGAYPIPSHSMAPIPLNAERGTKDIGAYPLINTVAGMAIGGFPVSPISSPIPLSVHRTH